MNTEPNQSNTTTEPNETPVQLIENLDTNTLIMAALSYAGPLLLIPLLMMREQSFVKFHLRQGIVLFAVYLVAYVVMGMFVFTMILWPLFNIIGLAVLALMIYGVVNVVKKQETPLPVLGSLASHIKI